MTDHEGQQFDNYRLIRLLGTGSFGKVYLAEHIYRKNQAPVAIKVLSQLPQDDLQNFLAEARITRLRHPNIVQVLDFGVEKHIPFIVMEYAPNGTLRQRHPKGTRVSLCTIVSYVKQIASALQYAHDERLVHRDIKPENLLIGEQNQILLSDFGLATIARSMSSQSVDQMAGTIAYMAPEQIQSHPHPASDQYSLGVVIYEWLCGERPFKGSFTEIAAKHTMVPPPPLHDKMPTITPEVEQIVMRALAKDSKQRFDSVSAFATTLEQACANTVEDATHSVHLEDVTAPALSSPQQPSTTPAIERTRKPTRLQVSQRKIALWLGAGLAIAAGGFTWQVSSHWLEFHPTPTPSLLLTTISIVIGILLGALATFAVVKSLPLLRILFGLIRQHIRPSLSVSMQSTQVRSLVRPMSQGSDISGNESPESLKRYPETQVGIQDFFISYTRADFSWAKWIKWHLDKAGYSTVLPPPEVRAGSDFEMEIQEAVKHAKRIIIVLSSNYFTTRGTQVTWIDTFQQKVIEEADKFLLVCVQECEHEFRKLLGSISYIDLSAENETDAQAILLARARGKGIELPVKPPFPGAIENTAPTFPGKGPVNISSSDWTSKTDIAFSSTTHALLVQQVYIAFTQNDWPEVIRKVDLLIKFAPDYLSPEVLLLQGKAFSEAGNKQRASQSIYAALALAAGKSQQLTLSEEYAAILVSSNQWNEVLRSTQEALSLAPENTNWLTLHQQSLAQLKATDKELLQAKPPFESSYTSSIPPMKSLEVFFSYSHMDKDMQFELEKFLSNLKRQHSIRGWYDGQIVAGTEWSQEIAKHLDLANIILLLVSQDFIASDYCYSIEMERAMERHERGEAHVIPIILRPAHWKETPIGKLQALPTGGKPITLWPDRDEAFLCVASDIRKVVDKLTRNRSLE
jgi:serine/threonine protein kinase